MHPAPSWRQTFRALRHRDFRLFIAGQVVSLIGTWMQSLALAWLVYRLTGSSILMGTVGFATHLPVLLLGPLAGIVCDRVSRRKVVIAAQSLFLVQASLLAFLTLTSRISLAHILTLALRSAWPTPSTSQRVSPSTSTWWVKKIYPTPSPSIR